MVLWFNEHKRDPARLISGIEKYNVHRVDTRKELVQKIMESEVVEHVLLVTDVLSSAMKSLAESLSRFCPTIPVHFVLPHNLCGEGEKLGYEVIDVDSEELQHFLGEAGKEKGDSERRQHPRFDWPLTGRFLQGGMLGEPLKVTSVSSGGAYLDSISYCPDEGTMTVIEITFSDFKLLVNCRVLECRRDADTQPVGFSVEFLDLSPLSERILDGIIWDELMRCVIAPEEPVHNPAIIPDES